ncbi:hypothetical protein BH09ACT8_BH09ACT8_34700 [soil metagenome]
MSTNMIDNEWTMIEEAVFRLFDDAAAKAAGDHIAIGTKLAELGWSDIEAEYPIRANELLFRAQGRALAQTDSLATTMLAELAVLFDAPVDGIVLPTLGSGPSPVPGQNEVAGIALGPVHGRLAVPVAGPAGTVSLAVVDADTLTVTRLDTFDPTVQWNAVSGPLSGPLVAASAEWDRAIAAAHRALATELIAVSEQILRIAVDHVSVRVQFGTPIGALQSPRHALADASAHLEGARALLGESWRYDVELSAQTAKIAAGRANRAVADAALQVCGAIGLTAEHDLHRYVNRGFQLDALCGSHQQLEALLAEHLFETYTPGQALPAIIALS